MKRMKFKTAEEEIEAIRREPAFRALVDELKSQTSEQINRLQESLDERIEKESTNGHQKKEFSEKSKT
jgi:uncharacterized phage-associated protein